MIEGTNHNSIDKFRITAGRTPSVTDLTDFTKSSWTMDDYTDGYFRFQQNGTVFRVKLLYKQRNRNQRNWLKSVKFDFIVLAAQVMEGGKPQSLTGYQKRTGQLLSALHVYSIDNFVAF